MDLNSKSFGDAPLIIIKNRMRYIGKRFLGTLIILVND